MTAFYFDLLTPSSDDVLQLKTDCRARVIWLIKMHFPQHGRYIQLERKTGIPARAWKNMCNKVTQPGIEMIAVLATLYPSFAGWLLTGQALGPQVNPLSPIRKNCEQ